MVPDFHEKILWLREFYTELEMKYPSYKEFLADEKSKQYFVEYFFKVWEGTGLEVNVEKFV